MKIHEIRDLDPEEISAHIIDARKQIVELRFQQSSRKLENPAKLRDARRHLARLLTIASEKSRQTSQPVASAPLQ
jgi:large subunit ribosomal protein L29